MFGSKLLHGLSLPTEADRVRRGNIHLLATMGALVCVALAGCGNKDKGVPAAAVVNGVALTAAEMNLKLSQYDHFPAERKAAIAGKMLKSMIDTELLRQAAVAEKLDMDPVIRARIDSTTRLILADAYMNKQGAAINKPSPEEIKAYYDQHPDLYAKRRVFEMEELMVQVRPDTEAEIKAKLGDGRKYNEFVAWLGQKGILNNVQPLSAAAEDMREEILARLRNAKPGDVIIMQEKDNLSVIRVHAAHDQPLAFEQAKAGIEDKLFKQRRNAALDQTFKQLREKAKIEYMAPYSEKGIAAPATQ